MNNREIVNNAIWTLSNKLGIQTTNTAALPTVDQIRGDQVVDLMKVDFYEAIDAAKAMLAVVPNDRPTLKETLESYVQIFEVFAGYAQRVSDVATNINERHGQIRMALIQKTQITDERIDMVMEKHGFAPVIVELIENNVEAVLSRHKLARALNEEEMENAVNWCENTLALQ